MAYLGQQLDVVYEPGTPIDADSGDEIQGADVEEVGEGIQGRDIPEYQQLGPVWREEKTTYKIWLVKKKSL